MSYLKINGTIGDSWSRLRETLGTYADDKPILAARAAKAAGRGFTFEADRLQALLDRGGPYLNKPMLQGQVDRLRTVVEAWDEDFADPEIRNQYWTGEKDSDLADDFGSLMQVFMEAEALLKTFPIPGLLSLTESAHILNSFRFTGEAMAAQLGLLIHHWEFRDLSIPMTSNTTFVSLIDIFWGLFEKKNLPAEFFAVFRNAAEHRDRFGSETPFNTGVMAFAPNSMYIQNPIKTRSGYDQGEVFSKLQMLSGLFGKLELIEGYLPEGLAFDPLNGDIVVADPAELKQGTHDHVGLIITDTLGEEQYTQLDIIIDHDLAATYSVAPAKPFYDYMSGDTIANVDYIPNRSTRRAQIIEGQLPPGMSFNASDGTIQVIDVASLQIGETTLRIRLTDEKRVTTELEIDIEILEGEPVIEGGSMIIAYPKPISEYVEDEIIASVPDYGEVLQNVVSFAPSIPGLSHTIEPSKVAVRYPMVLDIGVWQAVLLLKYENGDVVRYTGEIQFYPDSAFTYVLDPPKKISEYTADEVIGTLPESELDIENIYLATSIPGGISLNESNGELTVSDTTSLVAGEYPLKIEVLYEDGTEVIYLIRLIIYPDVGVDYAVNAPKPVAEYVLDEVVAYPITSYTITSIVITDIGDLPPGMSFDEVTGEITVTDLGELVAGSWPIEITTTISLGLEEVHNFTLEVL